PKEVAFRIDAYHEKDGLRDPLSTHVLRTLEGLAVSCQTSFRSLPSPMGAGTSPPEEDFQLTLRPAVLQNGWGSLEASLAAHLGPGKSGETTPSSLHPTATRPVSLGIPFEMTLDLPSQTGETYVIQITPYLP